MTTIEEKVIEESNSYFERNKDAMTGVDMVSKGAHWGG